MPLAPWPTSEETGFSASGAGREPGALAAGAPGVTPLAGANAATWTSAFMWDSWAAD